MTNQSSSWSKHQFIQRSSTKFS